MGELRIKQHPTPQYLTEQPEHEHLPPIPLRGLLLGPSGSGKTLALVDMLIRIYKGCWARIYVFSPSVDVDSAWLPVKKYVEQGLGVDPKKEQCFYSEWDPGALKEIVDQQRKLIEYQKGQKDKKLHGICIIVDDFADDPRIMHAAGGAAAGGSMLNTLFVRGRHLCISTLVSSQKLRLVSSTIRVNLQFLCVWRLRNQHELESLLEEVSAVYDKKTLMQMYHLATDEPYSFWYILLTAKRREDMFFMRFEKRLIPNASANLADTSKDGSRPTAGRAGLPQPLPASGSTLAGVHKTTKT